MLMTPGIRCGIDSIEIDRFTRFYKSTSIEQLQKIFAMSELAYGEGEADYLLKLAARFAVKEACLKLFPDALALNRLDFINIVVMHDAYGAPCLGFNPDLEREMERQGYGAITISISHNSLHAIAMAVAIPLQNRE